KGALIAGAMYVLSPSLVLFGATCMDGVFAAFAVMTVWLLYKAAGARGEVQGAREIRSPLSGSRKAGSPRPLPLSSALAILAGIAMAAATFMTWATICIVFVFAAYTLLQWLFDWRRGLRTLAMLMLAAVVFIACNYVLYRTVG